MHLDLCGKHIAAQTHCNSANVTHFPGKGATIQGFYNSGHVSKCGIYGARKVAHTCQFPSAVVVGLLLFLKCTVLFIEYHL